MGCVPRLSCLRRHLISTALLLSPLPRRTPVTAPPSSFLPLLPNSSNFFSLKPKQTPILGPTFLSTFSAAGFDVSEHQSSFSNGQQNSVVSEFAEQLYIPVKAYFLCTSIDLKSMQAENAYNVIPPASRSSNYIALRFCDIPPEVAGLGELENGGCFRYMVVFQYGSAVLFNIADNEAERYLELVREHASGLLPEMRKDDYAVVQKPQLETWMQGGLDYIVLKSLDIDGIRIIGSVLGQSIALDYFVRQVDGMVEEFTDINRGMEKTGTFTMQRKKLFQLVGKANSNLADVILKLGLFERSEIAWRNANYAQIWEYLRDEYELTQRFGSLDFKLKFVEHNIHFLQEILQNRKSDFLEWCIILLISLEIVISVYEIVWRSPISSP